MLEKTKKILEKTKFSFKIAQKYSLIIGIATFGDTVVFRNRGRIGKKCSMFLFEKVKEYIACKYNYVFCEHNQKESLEDCQIMESDPIWVFWWQGKDEMPIIISKCIDSIRRNAGKHPVILLDKNNYKQYVNIPSFILNKLQNGKISLTHFSDVLRFQLLYTHGGIWADASLYAVDKFTDNISGSFYTIRHGRFADSHVCMGLWSTFFIAAGKGNSFMMLVRDILFEYLKHEEIIINYFLIDCIMADAYFKIKEVREQIESVPVNNTEVFELLPLLNTPFDKDKMNRLTRDTKLFKLSYKNMPNTFKENSYYNQVIQKNAEQNNQIL